MTIEQVRQQINSIIRQNGRGSITAIKLRDILNGLVDNIGQGVGPSSGDGAQGPQGRDGKDGAPGLTGRDGAQGRQGRAGTDGSNGLQGRQGQSGTNGIDGLTGNQGRQGRAGVDAEGSQGPVGLQGPAGIGGGGSGTGDGTQGPVGVQGPAGAVGNDGDRGVQGPMGPSGSGNGGSSSGSQGSQGPHGSKGENGAQGPQGVGIDRIETYETDEAISEGGGVKTYRNVDIYLTNGSTSPAASFSFLESDSSSSGDIIVPDDETPLLKRSVRTVEDRLTSLEERVDDIENYCTLTLKLSSYALSSSTFEHVTYYKRRETDDGYEFYDPQDFWEKDERNGDTTFYIGSLLSSGSTSAVDFNPTVIFNNYEIAENIEGGVYQKKVKKGEQFNIKIFADGRAMVNKNYTIYNNTTENISMPFTSDYYLVVVPNKENAEIQIYDGNVLRSEVIWVKITDFSRKYQGTATILSYADGASLKRISIPLSNFATKTGEYNYLSSSYWPMSSYYEYGNTEVNGYESFYNLETNEVRKNVIIPLDLNGESNVSKYTLTIGEPNPSHAVLTMNRGWHEMLNERKSVSVGDTYEVYDGEKVSLHADTRYIDGNNYCPWSSHATISGNTTMTVEMPKENLYCYRFPTSNINDFHANYGFTNSAATAGEYGGWVNEENTPNGDGYYKLIYPDGYSPIFFIYSSGYVPVVKELMFCEHSHNSVVDTTMVPATSPYLNIEVLKKGFNSSQHDVDGEEHVYDGYQSITENSDGSADVWLYCAYVYNSYVREMVREPNSTLEFSVYSSSQFELTATHRLPDERWSIVTPSNPKGSYYYGYGFYGNDGMHVKFVLTNLTVAPNGYLGDITITNEEGLSKVFHIYCKWFHAAS